MSQQITLGEVGRKVDRLEDRFDKFEEVLDSIREEQATQRERQKNWNYGLGLLQTLFGMILAYMGIRVKL